MAAGLVPIKTPEGQAELATRQRRVSQRHRTVLFLVDGKRSAPEVRALALQAGVPESCFDELVAMGLIMLPEPTFSMLTDTAALPDVLHVDLPLSGFNAGGVGTTVDSVLPPSRSLYPTLSTDSSLGDSPVPSGWLPSEAGAPGGTLDPAVAEARLILLRAVRTEAPLAGSLTLLRLRRARTRDELVGLLDEVEARITKPHRALAAGQTMRRVRHLLGLRVDPSLASADRQSTP
ncbi:MAG TPA: hypothetical protein VFA35_09615 [Burkholderiaceae bacterium]|nr:hypothetical protein [Burkholderiaceae bacterium]